MQSSAVAFEDVYRKILSVNDDLIADKIDPTKALALHSGAVALSKNMSNEIKLYQLDLAAGKEPPAIGKRLIVGTGSVERPAIEGEAINDDDVKKLAGVVVDPEAPAKTRKPKLGFVGLSPTDAGSISSAFGEHADLLFWKDEGTPKLKPLAKCDVVFVNLSQVSHKTTEYLAANGLSAKNIVKVTGGVNTMKFAVKARFESGGTKS